MPTVRANPIKPRRKASSRNVRLEVLSELGKQGRILTREFKKTVETWNSKPRFQTKKGLNAREVSVTVFTDSDIYLFIDDGTDERWALMSEDWSSKTQPGVIGSRRGSGSVILRGRRAFQERGIAPREGIEARNFTVMISEKQTPIFQREVFKAIVRGIRKDFAT